MVYLMASTFKKWLPLSYATPEPKVSCIASFVCWGLGLSNYLFKYTVVKQVFDILELKKLAF